MHLLFNEPSRNRLVVRHLMLEEAKRARHRFLSLTLTPTEPLSSFSARAHLHAKVHDLGAVFGVGESRIFKIAGMASW
jgi:hypothetical protein